MAHRKAGGPAQNLRDSNPKYLGTKLHAGEIARVGVVIVRQRGTEILAGKNVGIGKDHTLFAKKDGVVKFMTRRKMRYDRKLLRKAVVHIV